MYISSLFIKRNNTYSYVPCDLSTHTSLFFSVFFYKYLLLLILPYGKRNNIIYLQIIYFQYISIVLILIAFTNLKIVAKWGISKLNNFIFLSTYITITQLLKNIFTKFFLCSCFYIRIKVVNQKWRLNSKIVPLL